MSQEKAQLIAPQGHFTVPGLNVAGVVTASSFSGNCTGTASSIAQGTNVVVGVMTASSFAGDVFGNAAGLSTTTAGLKLGIVTATSFAGNFTGIGSGLTGTPNIVAGLVTASQFIGNTPGLAGGISAGKNLAAGIVTATTFYGDGSNLTGAGSTAFIRQDITVTSNETTINLNNGNIIYFDQAEIPDTTVSFANTTTAADVTFIRNVNSYSNSWDIDYDTGGVTFDGSDDALSIAADSDFDFGTGAYTIEFWVKTSTSNAGWTFFNSHSTGNWYGMRMGIFSGVVEFNEQVNDQDNVVDGTTSVNDNAWHHVAICRGASGDKTKLYIDGKLDATGAANRNFDNDNPVHIGKRNTGYSGGEFNGILSNYRVNKGNAVYTSDFTPPTTALTNISGTVFLALQSTTDDTAYTVSPGTITASSSPTPGSHTITNTGSISVNSYSITWPSSITWNGGSAPTLINDNVRSNAGQIFNLVTSDTGTTWYGYEEVNADPQTFALFSWGRNRKGSTGQNYDEEPRTSSPIQIGSGNTWKHIEYSYLGDGLTATKTDGTLWSWGYNLTGQLGQNNRTSYSSPIQIPGTTWDTPWGSGEMTKFCVKTDGSMWSWGFNQQGALGQNTANAEPGSCSSPVQIPGTSWSIGRDKNAGGEYFCLSTKTDGTLWAWGSGGDGQLAQNSRTNYSSPVQVGSDTTWNKVGAGRQTGYGIKTNGTLWAWGTNSHGVMGTNSPTAAKSSPTQIPGTTWSSIDSGYRHSGAVKTDGTLWMWGEGTNGALAQNNETHYSSPRQVPGTTWSQVQCGREYSLAVKTDGTAWAWGQNQLGGNLGLNNTTSYSSPVQIPGTSWALISAAYAGTFGLQNSPV